MDTFNDFPLCFLLPPPSLFPPHPLLPSPHPSPPSAPPPAAGHGHTRHPLYTGSPPKHLSKAQLPEGSGSSANPLRLLWLFRRPAEVAETVSTQTQTCLVCICPTPLLYISSPSCGSLVQDGSALYTEYVCVYSASTLCTHLPTYVCEPVVCGGSAVTVVELSVKVQCLRHVGR